MKTKYYCLIFESSRMFSVGVGRDPETSLTSTYRHFINGNCRLAIAKVLWRVKCPLKVRIVYGLSLKRQS